MAKPSFRKTNTEKNDGKVNIYSNEKYFTGSIRKTQLITTYGVGSIVDFKDDTVIIASTDSWDYAPNNPEEVESRKIYNENLSVLTGKKYFLQPKTINKTNNFSKGNTIQSYIFPCVKKPQILASKHFNFFNTFQLLIIIFYLTSTFYTLIENNVKWKA